MKRKDYLKDPVKHIKINGALTVDQLIQQFQGSVSFGAGRLARACNIYEKMLQRLDFSSSRLLLHPRSPQEKEQHALNNTTLELLHRKRVLME